MAATLRGLPVSTTHALVGGLAGAGLARGGAASVGWLHLGQSFALPLLAGPLLAMALVALVYPVLNRLRRRAGVDHETCLCIGTEVVPVAVPVATAVVTPVVPLGAGPVGPLALARSAGVSVSLGQTAVCVTRYRGTLVGISAQRVIDAVHGLSAGRVGFSRGLNDTPKIAAIVLASGSTGQAGALVWVGFGMAIGALAQALRVGRTLGFEITPMNSGQGLTANLVTAALVMGASRVGVPVSTTHVSAGALFGLGASTRGLVKSTLRRILLAWVATLPAAFGVAALVATVVGVL